MNSYSANEIEKDVMGPPVTRTVSASVDQSPALKQKNELQGNRYLIAVGSRTARFRRKHQNKLLIGALLAFIILLLSFAVTMTILYIKQRRHKGIDVCNSKECIRSAANLAFSMDASIDPCEDFYQYACGNWPTEHPAPDTYSSYDWFKDKQDKVYRSIQEYLSHNRSSDPWAVEQASFMYKACLDVATLNQLKLKPVVDTLSLLELPKFPTILNITEKDESGVGFNWIEAVINVKIYLAMDVLIGFDIFTDPRNSSVYRLVMGSPETTNPFPSLINYKIKNHKRKQTILNTHIGNKRKTDNAHMITPNLKISAKDSEEKEKDENSLEEYKMYYELVLKAILEEAGVTGNTDLSDEEIDNNFNVVAEEYIKFVGEMYKIMEVNENETGLYEDDQLLTDFNVPEYDINALKNLTDEVAVFDENVWKIYLEGVFKVSNVTLDFEKDKVIVFDEDLEYLKLLSKLLSETSSLIIELYIWFQVVEVMIVHTTTEMRALHSRYSKKASGQELDDDGEVSRILHCSAAVNEIMGMAATYAIADVGFFENTKPKIDRMITKLKNSLDNFVRRTTWMDIETKMASIYKINAMKSLVGLPDWLFNEEKLNKYYEGIFLKPDKHLENLISLVQVRLRKGLNKFRDVAEVTWASDPTEVNAYHTFQENTIRRHFDQNGNMRQWWSNETIESFMTKVECFIKQYSTFYINEVEEYVDGDRTVGENLADTGGVRLAFSALDKSPHSPKLPGFEKFSQEQMFFLSYGNLWCAVNTEKSLKSDLQDEHPPTKYRLLGALQNSEEFAKAWHCRRNSTMNPSRPKCYIF